VSWWLVPGFVAAAVLAGLAAYLALRRPPPPLWPVVFLCQIFALLWAVGDLGTYFARDLLEKQLALSVLLTGAIGLAPAWWATAVLYVRAHGLPWPWLRRRPTLALPAAFASTAWLVAITNPWHGLFLTPIVGARNVHHLASTTTLGVSYALVVGASALLLALARRHVSPDVRRSARLLAFAIAAPLVGNAAYMASGWQVPLDFAGMGLCLASASIIFGIRRTRLFNLLPVALPEVLRHDPNGLLLLGEGGRLLYWNPAAGRILGKVPLEPDLELLAALAPRLCDDDDDEKPVDDPARLAERILSTAHAAGGSVFRLGERFLRISAVPIPARRPSRAGLTVRIEDVTRLRLAEARRRVLEDEVRHAEKLSSLGMLAGGIAHDFNNLLTTIRGSASLAAAELEPGSPVREYVEDVEAASRRASELTTQLLAYSGRGPRSVQAVGLTALVAEMVRLLEVSTERRARLELDLDPELPAIEADPSQIHQVVMNLVVNAAQATREGEGSIRIRTHALRLEAPAEVEGSERLPPGDYCVLEVSDSGSGMDEATRARMFDPFFSTKHDGRGLGLAVVFGIVRAHRGGIQASSERGVGSRFRVYFPSAGVAASLPATAAPPRPDSERWRGAGTVLVVDDDRSVRRVISRILQQIGFDVIVAAGGREAIEHFRREANGIRVVILDLTMPDLGGDEVLGELRRIDPEVPVIVSSGWAESDAMGRLDAEKIAAFLQKPYELADLRERIRAVLEAWNR
jgi:signal transduction histidine kinase